MAYVNDVLMFKSGGSTYVEASVYIYQDPDNPSGNPPYMKLSSLYIYMPSSIPVDRIQTPYIYVGGKRFNLSGLTWRTPLYMSSKNAYCTWPTNLADVAQVTMTEAPGDSLYSSLSVYINLYGQIKCTGTVYMPTRIKITPPSTVKLNALNHFTCTSFTIRNSGDALTPIGTGSLRPSGKGCALYIDESTPMDGTADGITVSGFYWYPAASLAQEGDFSDNRGTYSLLIAGTIEHAWYSDSQGGYGGVSMRWLGLASGYTYEGTIQYNTTPPSSCAPTVSLTATEVSGVGILAQYGRYVKGKSRVKYTAAVTYKYGAQESWFDLTVGSLYTRNKTLTFWPESNGTALAHAEDDHSGEKEVSASYRVYDYWTPALQQAIHRCRSDGTRDDAGSYCLIEWEINIAPLGSQNSRSLIIQHPAGTTTPTLNSYTASGELIVAADPERSYEITYILSDDFETVTRTVQLSTAGVIMDIFRGGHGVSFGKVAEKDYTLEISSELATILNTTDAKLINLIDALEALAAATGVDIYVHDQ